MFYFILIPCLGVKMQICVQYFWNTIVYCVLCITHLSRSVLENINDDDDDDVDDDDD
jgi:hypothetical protein